MKPVLKIIFSAFVAFMFFAMNMGSGFAQTNEELPPAPTEGIPSKDLMEGYGEIELNFRNSIQANDYLISGSTYIRYSSGNTVTVSGLTRASTAVDTIAVTPYLQIWDATNSRWVDVLNLGETRSLRQSVVQTTKDATIVKGHYYRTRAHHYIIHKGKVEQNQSFSSYIYIN